MTNQTLPIGKFSEQELARLERQMCGLTDSANLATMSWNAARMTEEFLIHRLTPEQLFALERIIAFKWSGSDSIDQIHIEQGKIAWGNWMFGVSVDDFIDALRFVVKPFMNSKQEVPDQLVLLGVRRREPKQ
ncbi:MAG: hypothetical protein NTV02_01240 [Candidatus Zambryskibacteria bacterium]|nr:hypothetical protein [Candidatus Zambryskibacteria bacterium]